MNILFRCDGSVKIGMGHVVRCLALADHLKEDHGCNINFAMRQSELGINKVKESYRVIDSNEDSFNYVKWFSDCIDETQSDILILDMRDGLTRRELRSIKNKNSIKVVTIDDPEDKRLEADLAFYPPVFQVKNLNWDGFKGKLYVGWEYIVLRKEFRKKYTKPKNMVPNILVSMGGTDANNLTEDVINALNQIHIKFNATIIVGNGYPFFAQLERSLVNVGFEYELHINPGDIAEKMSQSDLAIISFGQTAYELSALQVPAIYLCLTDDHAESSQLFVNEGLGTTLGLASEVTEEIISEAVLIHLTEHQVSKRVSKKYKQLLIFDLDKISKLIIGEKFYD